MVPLIALQLLYGVSIPISKFLLVFCPPIYFSGIRMTCAGIVLLGSKWIFDKRKLVFKWRYLSLYLQTALFGIYGKYILRNWSLDHMPAVKFGFMLNSAPFIAALFSFFYFGERLTKKQWAGLLIGFLGLLPILILKTTPELLTPEFFSISLPELAVFGALACHTYGLITARKLIKDYHCSAAVVNGTRALLGGSLAWITGVLVEGVFPIANVPVFTGWLLVLILTGNVVCQSLYLKLLRKYSVTFMSFTDFISPLAIAFYSWLFLGEAMTWHYAFSTVIVFFGLYLFYQDELDGQEMSSSSAKS